MAKRPTLSEDAAALQTQCLHELKAIREALQAHLLQEQVLSDKTAQAYNATLFHLQSAREELKKTLVSLSQDLSQ